jgi:protein-disulfide isomerase
VPEPLMPRGYNMSRRLQFSGIIDAAGVTAIVVALTVAAVRLLDSRLRARDAGDAPLSPSTFARLVETGQWLGPRNAAAVVLLYSDYGCGFSGELHSTLTNLMMRYPEHVAVVVKHFVSPRVLLQYRVPASAECAAEQARFAEYHAAAFAEPRLLEYTDGWRQLAVHAGVPDTVAFASCVVSGRYSQTVVTQYAEAVNIGVRVTPTLFVNGHRVVGAASVGALDSLIARQFRNRDEIVGRTERRRPGP